MFEWMRKREAPKRLFVYETECVALYNLDEFGAMQARRFDAACRGLAPGTVRPMTDDEMRQHAN
jgi:hypothetical protein